MKEAVYKLFAAAFTVIFFWGALHAMNVLGDLSDYSYIARAAEKNSGIAAAGYDIPAASDAYAEKMRTEPAPVTDEELSHIYIDGIRFDFPITLADITEHFETRKYFLTNYDEEMGKYTGAEILLKNGIGAYKITYTADVKDPSPEECTVRIISRAGFGYSEKYFPRVTAAGIDVFLTPQEEIMRLAALDREEYISVNAVIGQQDDGYVVLKPDQNAVAYYRKDVPKDMEEMGKLSSRLVTNELRLPEDYSGEIPKNKEELKKAAIEYASFSNNEYGKNIKETVTELYSTAYEFMADTADEYDVLYYELTSISRLRMSDFTDIGEDEYDRDTGYLEINGYCYFEYNGYEHNAETKMFLKDGDRLGDALIIFIDL